MVALVPGGYEGKAQLRAMVAEAAEALALGGSAPDREPCAPRCGHAHGDGRGGAGGAEVVARGWGGMRVISAVRGEEPATGAGRDAPREMEIAADLLGRTFTFATAPGVFSASASTRARGC